MDILMASVGPFEASCIEAHKERRKKWENVASKPPIRLVNCNVEGDNTKDEAPKTYLRRRCKEMGVSYIGVVEGDCKLKYFTEPRGILIAEIKERFPALSFSAIGAIFGGRNSKTILAICKSRGVTLDMHRKDIARYHDMVVDMVQRGMLFREIGDVLGFSGQGIGHYARRAGIKTMCPRGGS